MNFIKRKYLQYSIKLYNLLNVSDEKIVRKQYLLKTGLKLNLSNPQRLYDKINWLKLHIFNESYGKYADKHTVRSYIESKIGKEFLIDLIGTYDNSNDINFESLPNQFVIKATHSSGSNIIVYDKQSLDIKKTKEKISYFLKINYYNKYRERVYKNIKPRVVIEKFMNQDGYDTLIDYKFYCFNHKPEYVYIKTTTNNKAYSVTKKMDWSNLFHSFNNNSEELLRLEKPRNFNKMIEIATKLASEFIFVRVDLYSINNKIYFGELTFMPKGGYVKFENKALDKELSSLINLPI